MTGSNLSAIVRILGYGQCIGVDVMNGTIYFINPTSWAEHEDIHRTVDPFRLSGGPRIDVVHIEDAPHVIESQGDNDRVAPLVVRTVLKLDGPDARAFVIGCFSDPGLHAAREATRKPVCGIAEAALLIAMTLGHRIGVIAILSNAVAGHWRKCASMGIESRIGGIFSVDSGVMGLHDDPHILDRLASVGRRLRDERQCDTLVLGCAGMGRYKSGLEQLLGIEVVDPVAAAASIALGHSLLFAARMEIA